MTHSPLAGLSGKALLKSLPREIRGVTAKSNPRAYANKAAYALVTRADVDAPELWRDVADAISQAQGRSHRLGRNPAHAGSGSVAPTDEASRLRGTHMSAKVAMSTLHLTPLELATLHDACVYTADNAAGHPEAMRLVEELHSRICSTLKDTEAGAQANAEIQRILSQPTPTKSLYLSN